MKPKQITIKCECCGGTGKRPLSGDMHETLEAVMHLKNAHAAQVCEAIGHTCTQEAMSNRLADLMRLGFLTRKRNGKYWVYCHNDLDDSQEPAKGSANTLTPPGSC